MTLYCVTMFVEARSKTEALAEFEREILVGEFDRDALEVEESDNGFEDDTDDDWDWDDDE